MIDTHCHLDVERFNVDRESVLERAFSAGVSTLIVPGIGPSTWAALLDWPRRDARVQIALGVHPQLLPELPASGDDNALVQLDELLSRGVAIAVGECGLDGPTSTPMERQVALFEAHLALAEKHSLPVIVHCLRAQPHLQKVLKKRGAPPRGLLLHSYSGSAELVRFYLEHGCEFSFGGPVTYAEARRPLQAVRAVPADRLHAETDAPDQAPHPHRGERCEPSFLPLVIGAMAEARSDPTLASTLETNARRFFRL